MGYLLESQRWNVTLGTEEAQAPCSCSLHLHRRKQRHSNTSARSALSTDCLSSLNATHQLRQPLLLHILGPKHALPGSRCFSLERPVLWCGLCKLETSVVTAFTAAARSSHRQQVTKWARLYFNTTSFTEMKDELGWVWPWCLFVPVESYVTK